MKKVSDDVPVAFLCRHFGVSRSGYYSWFKGEATMKRSRQKFLKAEIQRLFENSKRTYGSPRIYQELSKKGHSCSENTVARMMKEMGLSGDQKKKFKVVTTDSNHSGPIALLSPLYSLDTFLGSFMIIIRGVYETNEVHR